MGLRNPLAPSTRGEPAGAKWVWGGTNTGVKWWQRLGSNLWPSAYEASRRKPNICPGFLLFSLSARALGTAVTILWLETVFKHNALSTVGPILELEQVCARTHIKAPRGPALTMIYMI